jgi:hypothetical protein
VLRRDAALPPLDPVQERRPQAASLPVRVHLSPDGVVAAAVVVLLPAALRVGDHGTVDLREQQVRSRVEGGRVIEPARDLSQREPMRDVVRRHPGVDELRDGGIVRRPLKAAEPQAGDRRRVRKQDGHRGISIGLR